MVNLAEWQKEEETAACTILKIRDYLEGQDLEILFRMVTRLEDRLGRKTAWLFMNGHDPQLLAATQDSFDAAHTLKEILRRLVFQHHQARALFRSIGGNVQHQRVLKQLTPAQLANATFYTPKEIGWLEEGADCLCSVEDLVFLASALQCSLADLTRKEKGNQSL